MPERVSLRHPRWRGWLILAALLAATGAAACGESLDGGAACPALCPSQTEAFRDTTIDAVALDTSIQGFPTLGLSAALLLANRPDTLVTSTVMRFDVVTTAFSPNRTGALDSITTVDSVFLAIPLDSTGRLGAQPVTIEAYDVDTVANDTVSTVVRSLFRADRRIGSLTVVPSLTRDSLRIPLSRSFMERKIAAKARVRVGLRIAQGNGQLRLRAFQFGTGAPTLRYDPISDTTYNPVILNTTTTIANAPPDISLSYQVYPITDVGSQPLPPQTLAVGGYPAHRTYLRFTVPARITDTATIVRAELLLTQRRSRFGSANDTVTIVPLVPTTTALVSDLRRVLDLSAEGALAAVDTARMVPSDSGLRTLNVLALARTWRTLPANVPRALAFRIGIEGAQPAELRFFSSEAPVAVRPKLRITYLPRSEFALP